MLPGTPIVLAPDEDDPEIAKDPKRLNNFDYDPKDQGSCPFAAHTRKSFPRGDMVTSKKHLCVVQNFIIPSFLIINIYSQFQAARHPIRPRTSSR